MNPFKVKYLTSDTILIQKVEKFIAHWFDGEPYIETQTSGSTGNPKVIRLEKNKMKYSAEMTGSYFNFQPNQTILLCLSPDSIGGKMLMLRAILHEMELTVVDLSRNPLEKIDFHIDFAAMVPMQIQTTIAENPEKLNFVRNLLIGGAAVSPKLEDALKPFQTNAFESFGMTETMSHVAVRKLNQLQKTPFEALRGIHFSQKDGNLVIHAPELGLPELETTDVVELLDEKTFFWKGRSDFAVNSGGIKFHPEMIEKKLASGLSARFFITGEKDPLLGERMVLVMEGNETDFSLDEIHQLLKDKLTGYEIPKRICFVAQFAETASGKVNRIETKSKIPNFQH